MAQTKLTNLEKEKEVMEGHVNTLEADLQKANDVALSFEDLANTLHEELESCQLKLTSLTEQNEDTFSSNGLELLRLKMADRCIE